MFPKTIAQVNTVLMLHAETPLPVATIARAAGVPYGIAVSALATLEKRGLVRRTSRVGVDEFGPNRVDPHYPMAYAAALVDLPLADALRGKRVYVVYAYGSLSRPGGGSKTSDLDLLIVGDIRDRAELTGKLALVGAKLGRAIDPFILSPEQFNDAKAKNDVHVASALAGVRILGGE
jgi:predicted nucleotidyltransferase